MENYNKQVVVAGHICLDITPTFATTEPVSTLSQLISPGKMAQTKEAHIHTGGAVANTGLAMKKLGAHVSLMGKIGDDPFGRIILEILRTHGVEEHMVVSHDATSYSIVLAPPGLDRMFLHYPGANNSFSMHDLDYESISRAAIFHFGYPTLMKNMYLHDGKELVSMFRKIKNLGLITSLDVTLPDNTSPAGHVDWRKVLPKVLPFVDIFSPNLDEIAFMLHPRKYKEWQIKASGKDINSILSINNDIQPMARELLLWGAKIILVKCGAPGIYFHTGDLKNMAAVKQNLSSWTHQTGFEPGFIAQRVLSTTGAGDASIAGFLTALIKGQTLKECLEMATAAGASCVEAYDTISGIKSCGELRQKIDSGWQKTDLIL